MKCTECGRELKEDSKFCDICGSEIPKNKKEEIKSSLNTNALLAGILISIFLTLIITGAAQAFGIPLIFGGLFLPFFWWQTKKSKQ